MIKFVKHSDKQKILKVAKAGGETLFIQGNKDNNYFWFLIRNNISQETMECFFKGFKERQKKCQTRISYSSKIYKGKQKKWEAFLDKQSWEKAFIACWRVQGTLKELFSLKENNTKWKLDLPEMNSGITFLCIWKNNFNFEIKLIPLLL